jgi:hypothetical protein
MSRAGLPGRRGVWAPSPDGKGLGPHSPTSPAMPNPIGNRPARPVPCTNESAKPIGERTSRAPEDPEDKARSVHSAHAPADVGDSAERTQGPAARPPSHPGCRTNPSGTGIRSSQATRARSRALHKPAVLWIPNEPESGAARRTAARSSTSLPEPTRTGPHPRGRRRQDHARPLCHACHGFPLSHGPSEQMPSLWLRNRQRAAACQALGATSHRIAQCT